MRRSAIRRSSGLPTMLLLLAVGACAHDEPTAPALAPPLTPPIAERPGAARMRVEGYPTPGERRSGWVLGANGRPMQVTYEVHDGLAIYEGDIVLGQATAISMTAAGARHFIGSGDVAGSGPGGDVQAGIALEGTAFKWPGGVVPYEIDPALDDQQRIADAITMIETTTGGITIVPRNGEADYVRFIPDDGCSSPIGRKGGKQEIKLAPGCPAGSVAHEIMHSLGVRHEQSRCDRDTYVEIQFDNVEDGQSHNFEKLCDGNDDIGIYAFGSIMHYPLDAFSKNGQPTIKLRPGITDPGNIGQRDALDVADRFTLNYLYGLNNKPPVPVICAFTPPYHEGSDLTLDGTCSTDEDDKVLTYEWNFGDGSCFVFPEPAKCTQAKPVTKYANDGVFKVGLFVHDGYELEATEAFITILNVAPSFVLFPFTAIDEGNGIGRTNGFSDPGADSWTGTVDYGDGSSASALPISVTSTGKSFSLSHTYADNHAPGTPFTLSVSITDDDVTTTHTTPITVRNLVPTVNAGSDRTFESGQTFNLSASFSDQGVLDAPWNWSVAWGFGSPTTGSTNTQGTIATSQRFCAAGSYEVVVSVTDKDGGTGTDRVNVSVGHVAIGLDVTPGGTPNAVSLKKRGSLPVALLGSSTFDPTTVDVASIRLGDEAGTDTPVQQQRGRYLSRIEDVNGDGRADLVVSFDLTQLVANGDLAAGSTQLVLRGFQGAGGDACINYRGADAVVVVP